MTAAPLRSIVAHPGVETLRLAKAAVLLSVSAILLRRRKDDPVAALLALAFLAWQITSSFDLAATSLLPILLDRLRFLLFVLALLLFPDGRWEPRWTFPVAIASSAVTLLGLLEAMLILRTRFFLPLAVASVAVAVASLWVRLRSARPELERQQLKWVALGLVVGIGLILAGRGGAALRPTMILWEAIFQLGVVVVALGFLVALLRYRLFDAETAIARSASYAALTISLLATFAATEAAIEWFGQQYLGMSVGNLAAGVGAAIAAAALGPLHHRISGWAEHRFQRDLVELKTKLPELLADLSTWASLAEVGRVALFRIGEALHAQQLALIVDGNVIAAQGACGRSPVDRLPTRLELPFAGGMSAAIAIGLRPDRTVQARDEREALAAILPALARALSIAAQRDRERQRQRRFSRLLKKRLAALSERIARGSFAVSSP